MIAGSQRLVSVLARLNTTSNFGLAIKQTSQEVYIRIMRSLLRFNAQQGIIL